MSRTARPQRAIILPEPIIRPEPDYLDPAYLETCWYCERDMYMGEITCEWCGAMQGRRNRTDGNELEGMIVFRTPPPQPERLAWWRYWASLSQEARDILLERVLRDYE